MLFAIGFVSLFVTWRNQRPVPAQPGAGHLSARNVFRDRHFHLIMVWHRSSGFCRDLLLVPKMFGRMMNETLAKMHFWLTFVARYAIFMPMHYYGMSAGCGATRNPRKCLHS